jgi:5-formyltetrahydrofolate cyclo-ligase
MNSTDKVELRKFMRSQRRSLSGDEQARASVGLLKQLKSIPEFAESGSIAMYLVNDGEIDPVQAMNWCWKRGTKTYVPVVVQENENSLLFAEINTQSEFRNNRFGISEPVTKYNQLLEARQLDLVLMPLVAFDESGNRIGMGGGFYDTTFEFVRSQGVNRPVLIGIAHEIQKVDQIVAQPWDIPLGRVVTDRNVYCLDRD